MKCALVVIATGEINNIVIADPQKDSAPAGCLLIGLNDSDPVDSSWSYDFEKNEFKKVIKGKL